MKKLFCIAVQLFTLLIVSSCSKDSVENGNGSSTYPAALKGTIY
ncbi:hypothetical protein [Sphingobacterium sp.]|nr:hypothetical protein [Sphingobacterium sp.]